MMCGQFDKTAQNEEWLPWLDSLRSFLIVRSPDLMGLIAAYNDLGSE